MRPVDTPSRLATSETRVAANPRSTTTWHVVSRISMRRCSTVALFTVAAPYSRSSRNPRARAEVHPIAGGRPPRRRTDPLGCRRRAAGGIWMFDLTGKVALVTGGSMGLGLTFSDTLAAAGADIALTARSTELLEGNASGLRERHGREVSIHTADVTDADAVAAVVADVLAAHGRI